MADIEITVDGGTSKRLLTAGKYCDKNILVTAMGGGGGEPEPPDDGKTRLYITVPANSMPGLPPPRNEVPLYFQQSVANGVTIDWGDDSPTETLDGTGNVNTTHTYQQSGDFVISLDPADGCTLGLGTNNSDQNVLGGGENFPVYSSMLKKAVIGSKGNTQNSGYGFSYCYSFESVVLQNGIKSLGDGLFRSCFSLKSCVVPDGVTEINSTFYYCYSLSSVLLPKSLAYIGSSSFRRCYGLKEFHILAQVPPDVPNSNAFEYFPSDAIIYVPVGSLEAYQTATNWSKYADQMQEEPT